jgi:hypothetical protein
MVFVRNFGNILGITVGASRPFFLIVLFLIFPKQRLRGTHERTRQETAWRVFGSCPWRRICRLQRHPIDQNIVRRFFLRLLPP